MSSMQVNALKLSSSSMSFDPTLPTTTTTLQHDRRCHYERHQNGQSQNGVPRGNSTAAAAAAAAMTTTTKVTAGSDGCSRPFPMTVAVGNAVSSSSSSANNRSFSCHRRRRSQTTGADAKSPFARSHSRVFYESDAVRHTMLPSKENDDGPVHAVPIANYKYGYGTMTVEQAKAPSPPFVVKQVDESGQFRRSDHRSNTSYKSQDSGFSDAAETTAMLTTSALPATKSADEESPMRIPNSQKQPLPPQTPTSSSWSSSDAVHSPVKKLAKWSLSAKHPLKMFWKQQDGSKVSMLKCCEGMSPFFPFYHHRQLKPSPSTPTTMSSGNGFAFGERSSKSGEFVATSLADSGGDHTGTWPRASRKVATACRDDVATDPSAEFASAARPSTKNVYYSTRLKRGQKVRKNLGPRFQEEMDKGNGGKKKEEQEEDESMEPKNNFRNTLFVCNSAVQLWLRDMHWSTEDECMNTLQSKAVARDLADVSVIATRNAKDAIVLLRRLSYSKSTELQRLKKSIDMGQLKSALVDCDSLSFGARCLLRETRSFQFKDVPDVQRHLRLVFAHCSILKQLMDRLHRAELAVDDAPSPLDVHFALELAFENLFDALVLCHLKTVVDILEEPPSIRSLKTAVTCIGSLGTLDNNLCHLIAKTGCIRSLLTVCIEPKYISIRALVLRSLATLCCCEGGIQDLEESGGVDCITDILSEKNASVAEKCEAAGVIAQITSPLLDNGANVSGLAENIPSLIRSLTDLARFTNSHDGFLLSTAAIGNLTFLASRACQHLVECKTVSVLVSACLRNETNNAKIVESVFVKDQVATILANMAGVTEGRFDIIRNGGLGLLLSLMRIGPATVESGAEAAACERVQQKSAIALSRLCSDAEIAHQVIELKGIQRLVTLCKDERERNFSDAVLVACLAVLRKIATACGVNEFKELNATELVEPRLLDSFLIYSSRQESYV